MGLMEEDVQWPQVWPKHPSGQLSLLVWKTKEVPSALGPELGLWGSPVSSLMVLASARA